MSWFKRMKIKLREQLRIVALNPTNFEEKWSFSSTRIQLISLSLLLILILGILFTILMVNGPFASYFSKNDSSVDRTKLEVQHIKIQELEKKIENQEKYVSSIRKILLGEVINDSIQDNLPEVKNVLIPQSSASPTENENALAAEVKDDTRTNRKKVNGQVVYFSQPIFGEVIQRYSEKDYKGVIVKSVRDMSVNACLSGTVLYQGYTQKDAFVILLEHPNGYISVYKNLKTVFKQIGAKIQTGDPIGIVGNSDGEILDTHLKFELWFNQIPVNPLEYLKFN
jgi:murein DD-endopeptidase MepM/ murein hydrolase activator NlpD